MLRIFSLIISVVAILGVLIIVLGYTSQSEYAHSTSFTLNAKAEVIWRELVNIKNIPEKKIDVESVEIISQYGRLMSWQENLKNGGYRLYRMNEFVTNEKLVIELFESSYGLKGIWAIELQEQELSTLITISEVSTLDNIRIRGIRTIFGRNHDLLVWIKYIKVGIVENLLKTP
jgi:hypothetical protein